MCHNPVDCALTLWSPLYNWLFLTIFLTIIINNSTNSIGAQQQNSCPGASLTGTCAQTKTTHILIYSLELRQVFSHVLLQKPVPKKLEMHGMNK